MCTVTYLPSPRGYILTHNRDEAPARSPNKITRSGKLLFPRDTKAGGAWVVVNQQGHTACLLNGAFLKHKHQPPYRRSRGLLLLDFFDNPDSDAFFADYALEDIEPFTLLFFKLGAVTEFRWDGNQRHRKELSPEKTHFWCSATLYPPAMQALREQVFRDWLAQPRDKRRLPSGILKLHLSGTVGDPENDFVMNRGGRVCTVSVTQVVCQEKNIRMRYFDLLEGHQDLRRMQLFS